jgi:hypothetical protein
MACDINIFTSHELVGAKRKDPAHISGRNCGPLLSKMSPLFISRSSSNGSEIMGSHSFALRHIARITSGPPEVSTAPNTCDTSVGDRAEPVNQSEASTEILSQLIPTRSVNLNRFMPRLAHITLNGPFLPLAHMAPLRLTNVSRVHTSYTHSLIDSSPVSPLFESSRFIESSPSSPGLDEDIGSLASSCFSFSSSRHENHCLTLQPTTPQHVGNRRYNTKRCETQI